MAQTRSTHFELSSTQYEIVIAFLNQKFNHDDFFYLDKFIEVENYSDKFERDYKKGLEFYRMSDSICKTSKDSLKLKLYCHAAFNRKKYKNLFSENDFNYLRNNYKYTKQKKLIIDINKLFKSSIPFIKDHTEDYYLNKEDDIKSELKSYKSKEFPNMKIKGIYLTKNNHIALISYSMIDEKSPRRTLYAVLKKENKTWWRFMGVFSNR